LIVLFSPISLIVPRTSTLDFPALNSLIFIISR
jgi:hypothetical protein